MHEKRSRRQFVKGTLGFLGGIGLTRIAGLFPESQFLLAQTRQEGNVIFSQENSFQKYTDEDYHFTLEYPSGWSIESNVKQVPPYPVPEAIIKRTTFFTPNGLVDIDMWTLQGQEFSLWLQNYAQTRNMPEILNASEGKIAGQEAKFFLLEGQTDRYTVFFSDGAYAYRLWNLVPDSTPALAGFWHMLDTFKLSDTTGQAATIPASIPQILTPTNNNISMVNSCCGYTCVGNPFTCCSQSNGYKGNCV